MEDERRLAGSLPSEAQQILASHEALLGAKQICDGSAEQLPAEVSGALAGIQRAAELSQLPLAPGDESFGAEVFPQGKYDADLQQVDLRTVNSWRLKLAEVPTVELLEECRRAVRVECSSQATDAKDGESRQAYRQRFRDGGDLLSSVQA
jgi:hypothetical protein